MLLQRMQDIWSLTWQDSIWIHKHSSCRPLPPDSQFHFDLWSSRNTTEQNYSNNYCPSSSPQSGNSPTRHRCHSYFRAEPYFLWQHSWYQGPKNRFFGSISVHYAYSWRKSQAWRLYKTSPECPDTFQRSWMSGQAMKPVHWYLYSKIIAYFLDYIPKLSPLIGNIHLDSSDLP